MQEIVRRKNRALLLAHSATLVEQLINKLEYDSSGHISGSDTYEEAARYARYGENTINNIPTTDANLGALCECLGNYHTTVGNLHYAQHWFEQYREIFKALSMAHPDNADYKHGLAISYALLGAFYRDHRHYKAQARAYFEQCHTLWAELTAAHPAYAEFQRNFESVKHVLASL